MISSILIANRGEIACRIIATAKKMGIRTIAIASDPDKQARHALMADAVAYIGGDSPATSYLDQAKILAAAKSHAAEAIHPGYGFLSENAQFVQIVEDHDLTFIGPTAEHIRIMGDK
ncbi:MAG: biotin carboxylase N-terminal domain-containing protein, partial [Alphaproteobacteria bacterium]|nr:biotin carboxylase N-terminal domain-containing protein [Alphaproteobacteria bacterium]